MALIGMKAALEKSFIGSRMFEADKLFLVMTQMRISKRCFLVPVGLNVLQCLADTSLLQV